MPNFKILIVDSVGGGNFSRLCLFTLIIGLVDNGLAKGDFEVAVRSLPTLCLPEINGGLPVSSFYGDIDLLRLNCSAVISLTGGERSLPLNKFFLDLLVL